MRYQLSDESTAATERFEQANDRFLHACRQVLRGSPYDAEQISILRIDSEKAFVELKATWIVVA